MVFACTFWFICLNFEVNHEITTLQIYTAGNGTHVKNVKVTSICRRYYNVEV